MQIGLLGYFALTAAVSKQANACMRSLARGCSVAATAVAAAVAKMRLMALNRHTARARVQLKLKLIEAATYEHAE